MEREPYWDYMGRRLKESRVMVDDNLYKRVFGGKRPYFSLEYSIKNKNYQIFSLCFILKYFVLL